MILSNTGQNCLGCLHEGQLQGCSQLPIHPDYKGYLDVWTAIESIKSIWKRHAARNGSVIFSLIDKTVPAIMGVNSIAFQHCLSNLVENAVKYTSNGRIDIFVSRVSQKNGKDSIAFTVRDTGCGIESSRLPTLFSNLHNEDLGSQTCFGAVNTGLYVTKLIVNELGGQVLVDSKPGRGSLFSIVLPVTGMDVLDNDTKISISKTTQYGHFGALNVLVVDDYELNQLTVKTLLHDTVQKVYCASDGYEALDILASNAIDIVFMDIHMPELDGIETTLRIRESRTAWADIAIIALTADPDYQHAHICRKIGMDGALAKPIRRRDLLHTFNEYCPAHMYAKTG